MAADYDLWKKTLEEEVKKMPVAKMSADIFKEFVAIFPVKFCRETFDWTGAKPIIDHQCLVCGRVIDGMSAPAEQFEYIKELDAYYLKRSDKPFKNLYKKEDNDDEDKKN